MEKIMERFRSISCDCVMWYQHRDTRPLNRERAKNLNQDWIHSAASSKGAGLSFHISALFFDIYEHKLSANELAFPSRPRHSTGNTHTHTHTHLNTQFNTSAVSDLCVGLSECISAHIKQSISSTSMTSKPQECRFQRFQQTGLMLDRTIPMIHVRCWFEILK